MKQRVLILAIGWEQVPLIELLALRGDIDLYAVHYSEDYYKGVEYKEVLIADMLDFTEILAFAKKIRPTAVISDQDDYAYLAQSYVATEFGLPGPSVDIAELATNKYVQRKRCQKMGIRVPRYEQCRSAEDLKGFAQRCGYPLIVKPVDARGSFGVSKVSSADEVTEAYMEAYRNSISGLVIAEQFIEGDEITVDGYCVGGEPMSIALATKSKLGDGLQVAIDIEYPGALDKKLYERAMRNNEVVCRGLGFSYGMTHAEYLIDSKGHIYLVEAANRGGGCFTSELIVPKVSGVDLVEELVLNALGESQFDGSEIVVDRNQVILKFFTFESGVIKSINGLNKLEVDPDVLEYRLAFKEGEVIAPITNDADRHGFVIVHDKKDARRKADQVIASITIEYE
ncbi:ATP-grasp domain-containing protein [Rubritalea marina]|uniref:ATP-grasp domain-containing protein n=1 Tax=Rubritalea marina TaxID=361055 RepID=UPI00035E7F92|nr:ATP-grasp domain-containing protein [Rubritalea marina]